MNDAGTEAARRVIGWASAGALALVVFGACPGSALRADDSRWRRERMLGLGQAGHAPPVRNRRLAGETGSKPVGWVARAIGQRAEAAGRCQ